MCFLLLLIPFPSRIPWGSLDPIAVSQSAETQRFEQVVRFFGRGFLDFLICHLKSPINKSSPPAKPAGRFELCG
jgi:hypothetical protein